VDVVAAIAMHFLFSDEPFPDDMNKARDIARMAPADLLRKFESTAKEELVATTKTLLRKL